MTEPPHENDRRTTPGAPRPHGPPSHGPGQYGPGQYGQPQYGQPQYGQPQYGQPPYGQPYGVPGEPFGPPAHPAPKSRIGLIVGATGLILLLIAGAVVLALTLGSTVLDHAAVERDVAVQFEEREGVSIDLTCPADMEVQAGAGYDCTGTTADGEDVTLRITVDDEEGARYSWTEP
jgi:hypothetical protein